MDIQAFARNESGKGVARALRRDGKLPAVIYSAGDEPLSIALDAHSLNMAIQQGGFFTHKHTLQIDGGKDEVVLARDLQRDPVTERVIHADFMRYDAKATVRVSVGVKVTGEEDSPGLEKGGVLQLVRAEVELMCRADSIPEFIVADMTGKDIGDAVHMSEITLPEGVVPAISDRDFTVASVVGTRTSTMADLDEDVAEGAEGEAAEGEDTEATAGEAKAES